MSLDSLYASLTGALGGGTTLTLGPGAQPGGPDVPPGIVPVLAQLNLTQLVVTGASVSLGPAAVLLTGQAQFLSLGWAITLTGESPDGTDQLTLRLQGTGLPPTLGALFGVQPPVEIAAPSGALVVTEGVLDPIPIVSPVFTVATGRSSARLQGALQMTQNLLLARYVNFLGDRYDLDGSVVFPALGRSQIDLEAQTPEARTDWVSAGTVIESAGLRLTNHHLDPNNPRPGEVLGQVELFAVINQPVRTRLSMPLLQNDSMWTLRFAFEREDQSLQGGLAAIARFLGASDTESFLSLPPGFDLLGLFYISLVELGVSPGLDGSGPALRYSSIRITSREPWNTPVPFISMKDVGTQWLFRWSHGPEGLDWTVTGTFFGTFMFGKTKDKPGWPLTAYAYLPQFDVWVSSDEPLTVPIGDALSQFNLNPGNLKLELTIAQVEFLAMLQDKTVAGYLVVEGDWSIDINRTTFALEQIALRILVSQESVSGSLVALASIKVQTRAGVETKAVFQVGAEYPGTGNWIFTGSMPEGTLPLLDFIAGFLNLPDPPAWAGDFKLTDLFLRYDTAAPNPYLARGKATTQWDLQQALGITLKIDAGGTIERRKATSATDHAVRASASAMTDDAAEMVYAGELSGAFQINRVRLSAGLRFDDTSKTYFFRVEWDNVFVQAVASDSSPDKAGNKHKVITVTLGGTTLGALVEKLVDLVNPNANYHLEPPWDVLNRIDLSRFSLLFDPTENRVELRFAVNLSLVFADIRWVGLVYDRSSGDPSVYFQLGARLLGRTYGDANADNPPLKWDALKDPPPEIPGTGVKLLELRYLGLGQHVTLDNMSQLNSIGETITALRAKLVPPASIDTNPLANNAQLVFAPNSEWLIGLDLTVLEFVRIAVVFNDPKLYGLLVELSGPKAKSLAGLSFELLYKKVTDDIGVFRVRLKVPDAFRQFDLGAIAVTLGIITVDIYTNGNFRVDLGFPEKRNFEAAFCFQMGPFLGRGGIYFALLNGATSSRVPLITNGTFSPVIELGIGMAVGVGREFNKGVLKAGLYVQVEAIFIGVLAWFHPTDDAQNTELYYSVQGTAAISGKLYGKVDFKIISASICIEAYASVTVTIACYQPILIDLDVGVSVKAEVDLYFFTVSYSFETKLHASFVIGEARETPWLLAADQSGRTPARLARSLAAPRRRRADDLIRLTRPAFHAMRRDAGTDPWNPDQYLFPNQQPVTVQLTLMPMLPIADASVAWTGTPPVGSATPSYQLAFLMLAAPPGTLNGNNVDVSFGNLIQIALRWSLSAVGVSPADLAVTPAAVDAALALLNAAATADSGFTYDKLDTLFSRNLRLDNQGPPSGTTPASGVAFPMIPNLGWNVSNLPDPNASSRNFWTYCPVDSTYEAELRAYLNQMLPGSSAIPTAAAGTTESMATFVFRDYFLLLAKSAMSVAQECISQASLAISGTAQDQSLADIARSAPGFQTITIQHVKIEGDTLDEVASSLGHSDSELLFWNPTLPDTLKAASAGATVPVVIGITPQSLARANGDIALRAVTLALGSLPYQIRSGETLGAIAGRFGMNLSTWLNPPNVAPSEMLTSLRLLQPGAPLVPGAGYAYANTGGLTTTMLAAVFYVRLNGHDDAPFLEWYAQAIVQLTPGIEVTQSGDSIQLPPSVTVPGSHDGSAATVSWTCLAGDTLLDIAAYFALTQNPVPGSAFASFSAAFTALNPGSPPQQISLPPTAQTTVRPNETLALLATRLLLAPDSTVFITLVGGAAILRPLVSVTLLGVTATVTAGTTLAAVANLHGLALEVLADRIQTTPNLLAATPGALTLHVPYPPKMNVSDLIAAVLASGNATQIANQVSRFMMHGLRVPAPAGSAPPYHATGPLTGLYALTGQQVLGRAPPTARGDDPTQPLSAEFLVIGTAKSWISMLTGSVTVSVSHTDLATFGPDSTLTPEFAEKGQPASAQLWTTQKMRWDLPQVLAWQTPVAVTLPGPQPPGVNRAMPGLWPLPAAVMARAGGTDDTYSLVLLDSERGPNQTGTPVQRWAWASTVEFSVRRIAGLPGIVEVFGADTAARRTLLEAWRAITPTSDGKVSLLYSASPANGLPAGLTSVILQNDSAASLIKANLSTETHSGINAPRQAFLTTPVAPAFAASINRANAFLMLLWESSVVGGGGFWLQATAPGGGPAWPDSIFDSSGTAVLTALITADVQMDSPPSRKLLDFNNCAIVGDAFDASTFHLVVETSDESAAQRLPNLQPGNVAFQMTLLQPPAPNMTSPGTDKSNRTRRYYQHVGYGLLQTAVFSGCAPGVPIGPQSLPPSAPGNRDRWSYRQVIPAARFAPTSPLPATTGLPEPALDPYAGIELIGQPAALAAVRVQLWFQDMLGNATSGAPDVIAPIPPAPPAPLPAGQIDLPVGYFDSLISVANWPAATTSFHVPAPSVEPIPTLVVELGFQPGAYTAGPSEHARAAAGTAADHLARYTQIYFQIMRADVQANLLTSLKCDASGKRIPLTDQIGALRSFVFAAHAYLFSMAQLTPAMASTRLTTLAQIAPAYGVSYDGLAAANADRKLLALFAGTGQPKISAPRFAIVHVGDNALDWDPTQPASLLENARNSALALRVGVELAIPVRPATTPATPASFTQLATAQNCDTSALIAANVATAALLKQGEKFTYGGADVFVDLDHPTLNAIAKVFRDTCGVRVDALTLGMSKADDPALLLQNATFYVASYTASAGDTLATNRSGASLSALAGANTITVDLFEPGTPIYLQSVDGSDQFDYPLADAARAFGISGGQLLDFNANTTLAATARVALPGFSALPAVATDLRLPYRMAGTDTLDSIATMFLALPPAGGISDPVVLLGLANAALPGPLVAGKTLTLTNPSRSATTHAGDSLDSFASRFSPPAAATDVIAAIRSTPGFLAEAAVLLCPPALVPQISPASPAALAAAFHVDPVSLALSNASLAGVVKANATVALTRNGVQIAVVAPANPEQAGRSTYSLNSFVTQFEQKHVTTTLAEIIAANSSADLFATGATLVLPPPLISLSAPIGSDPTALPGPILAIDCALEILRSDSRLVLEDFRGKDGPSPVERARSPIAARGARLPAGTQPTTDRGALTLDAFVADLERSLPYLRVCSGKVAGSASDDVWAIGFGPGLIEQVAVAPSGTPPAPTFFALRPLFNHLVTRQVQVARLKADGTLDATQTLNFQGIDTDVWARELLGDIELFLSAGYAAGAYRGAAQTSLINIIQSKLALAGAIADGIDFVIGSSVATSRPPNWAAAREYLHQSLLFSLDEAWDTDVVLQYGVQANVASKWAPLPARISGVAGATGSADDADGKRVVIAGASIDLAEASSFATFGVTLQKPPEQDPDASSEDARQSYLSLDLRYSANEVEFDIAAEEQGYTSSNWLSFAHEPTKPVAPPGWSIQLGATHAPLPLRDYPAPARVIAQSAQKTYEQTSDWSKSPLWTYSFICQHASAAQDQLRIEVSFNRPARTIQANLVADHDLFASLAQYSTVRNSLWTLLKDLPATTAVVAGTPLYNAIQTFETLVKRVSDAWQAHWTSAGRAEWSRLSLASRRLPATAAGQPPYEVSSYLLTSTWVDTPGAPIVYRSFVLDRDSASTGAVRWPTIHVAMPGGSRIALQSGSPVGNRCIYDFPSGANVPVGIELTFELSFSDLHAAVYQMATAEVAVIRNARLLGPDGPPTNDRFIFMTEPASFADSVVPLLSWDSFDIGPWQADGSGLANVMRSLLSGQDSGTLTVSVGLYYGYELIPGTDLRTRLPVSFRPLTPWQAGDAAAIAGVIEVWRAGHSPSSVHGEWVIAPTLYSNLPQLESRPLLQIQALRAALPKASG